MGFWDWFWGAPASHNDYWQRTDDQARQPDSFLDGSMWQETHTPNIPSKDPTEGILGDYYRQRSIADAFSEFFGRSENSGRGRQQASNGHSQGQRSWGGGGNYESSGNSQTSYGRESVGASLKGPWHVILGCSPNASPKQIQRAYREQAKRYHPDHGGSNDAFLAIGNAYEEGIAARGKR